MKQFNPIIPADFKTLKPYFQNQPFNLNAYSLSSAIGWSITGFEEHGAIVDDILFIWSNSQKSCPPDHMLLPLAKGKTFPPKTLASFLTRFNLSYYYFVPAAYLSEYGLDDIKKYFTVEEQVDFEDYIYRYEDLAELKGKKYAKKRNLISQFKKIYVNAGRVKIEKLSFSKKNECIVFLNKWCEIRECDHTDNEDLACEKQAAINTINHFEQLEAKGIIVRIDGEVNAFAIASHLNHQMGVLQFEKAFPHIKGLYQFLDNEGAKQLFAGYKFINKENDMNLPGLAKAKKSYHPIMREKSYKLKLHTN